MEPFPFTLVGVACHHFAVAYVVAVAVQRFVSVDIAILLVFLSTVAFGRGSLSGYRGGRRRGCSFLVATLSQWLSTFGRA